MSGIVTIGPHEEGPHVDALLALAERCGAVVVRLPSAKGRAQVALPREARRFRKVGYAGREFVAGPSLQTKWGQL